ncbi:AraC family transcriptional regulator [Paenibacillus sp. GYB006]|uniref:AraC family transcriptional regulator n=1 Tax=Paenibacillus sp. GYB006 TaxID=2994394 RepID=UPI002F96E8CD
MKRMFEAVIFGGSKLFWDYRHINTTHYKGYYHWHQCCEVLYVHDGTGHVIVNGKSYPIRRGMLFFFRPYQLHHVYANVSSKDPYIRTIFHVDPQLVNEMLQSLPKRRALFTSLCNGNHSIQSFDLLSYESVVERDLEDYQYSRQEGKGEDTEEIAMLILRLLDILFRDTNSEMRGPVVAGEGKSNGYAQKIMSWIDEHYQESFRLDDLAEVMHLSKFYLSKLFHEQTGSTLKEYITAKRMRQACRLLETSTKSVEWIGSEVGISNPSYFVQVFKQEVGTTPLKYRTRFIQSDYVREDEKVVEKASSSWEAKVTKYHK